MYALLLFLAIFIVTPIGIVLKGWVLSTLWTWFAIPVFHAPALGIPSAIGVSLIVSYLTHQAIPTDNSKSKEDRLGEAVIASLLTPFAALLFGWIVNHWMPGAA